MKAHAAMTRDVVCIAPADDLDAAHAIMERLSIRHLPVLDGETLVGILSDRDVLLFAQLEEDELVVPTIPVQHVMTPTPITVGPNATVGAVADLMLSNKIDSVPVVDANGKLVGLVTSSDLLELLRTRDDRENKVLPFEWHLRTNALQPAVA
jgi:acetoin utilization protein AcuB